MNSDIKTAPKMDETRIKPALKKPNIEIKVTDSEGKDRFEFGGSEKNAESMFSPVYQEEASFLDMAKLKASNRCTGLELGKKKVSFGMNEISPHGFDIESPNMYKTARDNKPT